jgi:hypothetical protein
MNGPPRRTLRLGIPAAGAVLAVAWLALRSGAAPSATTTAALVEAPAAEAPAATTRAAPGAGRAAAEPERAAAAAEGAPAAETSKPTAPPDKLDRDADNREIEPELPQTPEWKMGKTQQILRVVEARASRVEAEIAALEAEGKAAEAAEQRVLLGRLHKQVERMKADVRRYTDQILAAGGQVPEGGFAPDGAPR